MRCSIFLIALAMLSVFSVLPAWNVVAQESPFEIPPGLENAVAFWKQIFPRYGTGEVVLFDPLDMSRICAVVRALDNEIKPFGGDALKIKSRLGF